MVISGLSLRDFRSYESAQIELGAGLTIVCGANGAGKTNLVEGLYFGCTGRSFRTANDREVVRFGAAVARVELAAVDGDGEHCFSVGFAPGEPKRLHADGVAVERLTDVQARPLVCVFAPDRLELIKGSPALRRAHLDALVEALWPARAQTRRAYARALAQRNALLGRVRAGIAGRVSLGAWDSELAHHGVALRDNRAAAVGELTDAFAEHAEALGLTGDTELAYRPRTTAAAAEELAGELAARVESDLIRGFTGHGPHRDELLLRHDRHELRVYGSQGQQRLALLALLLAERDALTRSRGAPPLLLLDDVTSELDGEHRARLAEIVAGEGQTVVTTTDVAQVPGAQERSVTRLVVSPGAVMSEAVA
ncbi:MAG: DNA replication/repair protein RecF [Solirubrobacteraceae bacterium]|nr:MAG: hypothetical protein DLM63_13315 [Solirubrobacterales bacterium]